MMILDPPDRQKRAKVGGKNLHFAAVSPRDLARAPYCGS